MANFRIKKTKEYCVLPNALVQDKRLSHKARGVLCYLLSKPDDWVVKRQDLLTPHDGDAAIRSALQELKATGYIKWEAARNAQGKILRWEYNVYEGATTPDVENPHVENPHVENPLVAHPHVENHPPLLSTEFTKYREEQSTEKNQSSAYAEDCAVVESLPASPPASPPVDNAAVSPSAGGKKHANGTEWPLDDKPLYDWLCQQDLLTSIVIPLDHAWWATLSWVIGWPEQEWVAKQFAKMQLWLRENPKRKPTPRGTSRFIRSWLETSYEKERRDARKQSAKEVHIHYGKR